RAQANSSRFWTECCSNVISGAEGHRICRADILSDRSDNVASKELTSCLASSGDSMFGDLEEQGAQAQLPACLRQGMAEVDSRRTAASYVQPVPTAQTTSRRHIPGSLGRIVCIIVAFLLCRLAHCHTLCLMLGLPQGRPEGGPLDHGAGLDTGLST